MKCNCESEITKKDYVVKALPLYFQLQTEWSQKYILTSGDDGWIEKSFGRISADFADVPIDHIKKAIAFLIKEGVLERRTSLKERASKYEYRLVQPVD